MRQSEREHDERRSRPIAQAGAKELVIPVAFDAHLRATSWSLKGELSDRVVVPFLVRR